MPVVWDQVFRELSQRPSIQGREVSWLAEKLQYRLQRVSNWRVRDIPARDHAKVAAALGWTVERLLGKETMKTSVHWPFHTIPFERFNRLTERQKGVVEDAMSDAIVKVENAAAQAASWKQRTTGTE